MSKGYKVVDESNWKRSVHCAVFRNSVEPQYCVSLELDVTKFLTMVKKKGFSFTFSMIYYTSKCANTIEEFRYRFLKDEVVLYDKIDTAFTYMDQGTELFKVVRVPLMEPLEEYLALARKTAEAQKEYFTGPLENDVFQFSPMPWVSFTHISHTISGKKNNATPILVWGKYYEKNGKVVLPFSVQVHHSFVDGVHIGTFIEALQRMLDEV